MFVPIQSSTQAVALRTLTRAPLAAMGVARDPRRGRGVGFLDPVLFSPTHAPPTEPLMPNKNTMKCLMSSIEYFSYLCSGSIIPAGASNKRSTKKEQKKKTGQSG